MRRLPLEPGEGLVPFAPAATRSLSVFGNLVELVFVPERSKRPDRATAQRPAFAHSPASRITHAEAVWRDTEFVLTPNRYPFAAQQRLLWPARPQREPDAALWFCAAEWTDRAHGSALYNQVGAAATIARCHVHLVPERQPFLPSLPEHPCTLDLIELPAGAQLLRKDVPFCLLGVRGSAPARAAALVLLAEARLVATCNVVLQDDVAWIYPRRLETPSPHFPWALGAAELWGRWCFQDEAVFAAASGEQLEQALITAGMPALPQ